MSEFEPAFLLHGDASLLRNRFRVRKSEPAWVVQLWTSREQFDLVPGREVDYGSFWVKELERGAIWVITTEGRKEAE